MSRAIYWLPLRQARLLAPLRLFTSNWGSLCSCRVIGIHLFHATVLYMHGCFQENVLIQRTYYSGAGFSYCDYNGSSRYGSDKYVYWRTDLFEIITTAKS